MSPELARLRRLQKSGYSIHLFFLWIPDVRLSLARVASRVKMGGHDISEPTVRRRFHKGIRNFLKHYRSVTDSWMLFDNSGAIPRLVAEEKAGTTSILDRQLYDHIVKLAEGQ